jgi:hypothetical protein
MKKLIITTFILLIISCKGQTEKNTDNNKTNTMEKFDINKFNKLEKDNDYSSTEDELFYKSQDKRYRILLDEEIIVEETNINTAYSSYEVYFKKSRQLKAIGREFYSFPVGISKEYNEEGKLIREIEYDKDYKFSIEDLTKKMKEEYKIDILKKSSWVKVMRDKIDSGVIYKVMVYLKENKYSDTKNYTIDGTTGKLMSEKVLSYPKE